VGEPRRPPGSVLGYIAEFRGILCQYNTLAYKQAQLYGLVRS